MIRTCGNTIAGKEAMVGQNVASGMSVFCIYPLSIRHDVQSRARPSDIRRWVWRAELVCSVAWSWYWDTACLGTLFAINGTHVGKLGGNGSSGHVVGVERAHGCVSGVQRLGATSREHRGVDSRHLRDPRVC
jgi:hypothetical protein